MDEILANIFIVLSIIALLVAVGFTGYSVWHSLKENRRAKVENGVPTQKITIGTIVLLLIIALPSLLIGSMTDMCIITGLSMLLIASAAVIYSRVLSIKMRKS